MSVVTYPLSCCNILSILSALQCPRLDSPRCNTASQPIVLQRTACNISTVMLQHPVLTLLQHPVHPICVAMPLPRLTMLQYHVSTNRVATDSLQHIHCRVVTSHPDFVATPCLPRLCFNAPTSTHRIAIPRLNQSHCNRQLATYPLPCCNILS